MTRSRRLLPILAAPALLCLAALNVSHDAAAQPAGAQSIRIRGHELPLIVYGSPGGDPVVLSSGDGGWVHLAPHVAEFLGAHGCFVLGFDVKAYLESFTSRASNLRMQDEPGDYQVLADAARHATGRKPILIGVSEGAGLSVLAATDPRTKASILGVVALGLPDINELAWRWKDAIIYLTHRPPNEPSFSTASIVGHVAPAPLAAIHSTHDEFVPLGDVERILSRCSGAQAALGGGRLEPPVQRQPRQLRPHAARSHRLGEGERPALTP